MATREEQVTMNSQELEKMCVQIQSECPLAKQVRYSCTNFYPNVCFVVVDALNPQDYPNGIGDNSIFLMFRVDFEAKTVEYKRSGHIYLSEKDKRENPKLRYLAMNSMVEIATRAGVKKMRKSQYKDNTTAAHKMATYFNEVMEKVVNYTDGYPYKQGVEK
jgi:hypothetical protein